MIKSGKQFFSSFIPENWNTCFRIQGNQIFNLFSKSLPILTCILKSVKRKQKKNMKQISRNEQGYLHLHLEFMFNL